MKHALLCLLLLLAACAGRVGGGPRPLTPKLLEQHAALEADDHRGRARFAYDLGLGTDAISHGSAWLLEARARVRIEDARSADRSERAAARRDLERAARFAVDAGRRFSEPNLVLEGALAQRRPKLRDLAWGSEHAWYWSGDPIPLLEATEADPRAWVAAWSLVDEFDWSFERLEAAGYQVPSALLSKLGPRGNDVRWALLDRELRSGALSQRAVELAATIANHDPTDVRACVLLQLREDMRAGALVPDVDLFRDQILLAPSLSALSRARRRAETYPDAPAVALHHAQLLLARGLSGDALDRLEGAESRWANEDQHDIAALLEAIGRVHAGRSEGYEAWRERHDDAASLAADRSLAAWRSRVMEYGRVPKSDSPIGQALEAALVRRVALRDPQLTTTELARAWGRSALARRDRPWVRAKLGAFSPLVRACLDRGGSSNACGSIAARPWMHASWAIDEYGLDDAYAYAMIRVASADELGDAAMERIETARETTLALSSSFTGLYVSVLIERGDLDAAATWLTSYGSSLAPHVRAALELTIADRREGIASATDQTFALFWPGVGADTREVRSASADSPWYVRAGAAADLVTNRQFDRAETIYLALGEDAPGTARTVLLGLAAQAALEAGRVEAAAAHVSALPAEDTLRLELDGLIAAERGDTDGARAMLLDAWPARPSAGSDLLRLGVSLQTKSGLAAFRHHGALSWWVEEGLRSGSITDLSTLAQMQVLADDPARAWDRADTLVPELIPVALQHGDALLEAATTPSDARAIAAKLRALHQRRPDPEREPQLELMLLTGEHAAALSMARSEVPEQGIEPLASTHAVVRLHRAGQDGSVSAEALWHEWRWRAGVGDREAHRTLLDRAEGPLLGYACMLLSDIPEDPRALPTCQRAWQVEKGESYQAAVNYSYLLLAEEVPPPGKLAILFETTPPPPFAPSAAPLRDRDDVGVLHQNLGAWLSLGGEDERAAQAHIDAYAYAQHDDVEENLVPESEYGVRAEHAHAGTLNDSAEAAVLYARVAYQALRGLHPDAAQHYAEVSEALPSADPAGAGAIGASRAGALAPLLADDLEFDRAPPGDLGRAIALAYEADDVTEIIGPLADDHPDAGLFALLLAESEAEQGRGEEALERLAPLEAAHPSNPLVGLVGTQARLATGDVDGAKARYAAARSANPDSALLVHATLPESVVGARAGVPEWARTPEAFANRLDGVSVRDMMALLPRYERHTEIGADGFFPLGWERRDDPLSSQSSLGPWVQITQDARASRCVGEACLVDTLDALGARGYTRHFVRTSQLPAGEATEAALTDASTIWLVSSVPVGGRVFTLLGAAPLDRAELMLDAFALLRRGFAPLDAVVPAFAAASLRADGSRITDRARLLARLETTASEGPGCPATAALADASEQTAAELVLDLYLSSTTAQRRARVLACASPRGLTSRRVALAALLDEDASMHAWGREAVHRHASRALRDAALLLPMGVPLSAPDYFERPESGLRGRIELGLALPEPVATGWVAQLVESDDPQERVDGWVIASQRPEVGDVELAERTARTSSHAAAFLAFDVLEQRDPATYAAAVRARFDSLDPETLPETRYWEARALGYGLIELGEAGDGARLREAAKRFAAAGQATEGITETLERFTTWHRQVREGMPSGSGAFNAVQRAEATSSRAPRPAAQLEDAPLAELLPTRHWTFARVASPGLFGSTVLDLTQRLDPGDPTQRLMVDRAVETLRKSNGFDALLEGGGLDLAAPIECASMAGDSGFVCSATVADRDALLTEFGRRGYDSDAGLALVLQMSKGAGGLPVGLSILPTLLHELVYDEPEQEDDDAPPDDPAPPRYERLRHHVTIAGYDLHYYAIIEADEDSVGTDAERYLFIGDRVLVFSNDFMARQVLFAREAGVQTLADDAEFTSLTSAWKDGSALQAAAMGMSSPIDGTSVASEVVADGDGITFRYSATTEAELGDMTNAEAHLPPGAVSTFVVAYPEQDEDDLPELTDRTLAPGDVVPPLELLSTSSGAAFGWYAAPGDGLWRQWVLVLPQTAPLRRAAGKSGVRRPSRAPQKTRTGWWYGEVDGLLVLSSTRDLARLALDRPSVRPTGTHLLGRGTFDGSRAAEVVARLPATAADVERVMLRFFASIVGLVEDVGFEATWDPATKVGTMKGRISLRLRDHDDTEVVDQWLAAARFRNAAELPRTLSVEETQGTLRFSLVVGDAQGFADRSVFPSGRASVRVLDDTHVELTVRAKASDKDAAETLTEARKKKLLDTSTALRIHDASIQTVRDTLTKDTMTATQKAAAITAWVHERIAYEVTPRSLDATQILEVGRGDCSEYARLSVALLRSAGVPAEVRSGMAAQGSDMVAHAWVAYHDGTRWFEVDPTWGRMKVTAGHLPLEVTDVLALVSLGQLEIEAIASVR